MVFGSLTGAKKKKKKKKEKKLGSYIFAGNGNGMKTRRMKKSCYIHYTRYILWREWWREYRDAGQRDREKESLARNGRLHRVAYTADMKRERFMGPQELCGT